MTLTYCLFHVERPFFAVLALLEMELYRHFDAAGRLLYVGISLSAVIRLCQHRNDSEWFGRIARIEIERFDTKREALRAERRAIEVEFPVWNIVHNAIRLERAPRIKKPKKRKRLRLYSEQVERAYRDLVAGKTAESR